MERIEAFKLSDGSIVETSEEAVRIESESSFVREARRISEDEGAYFDEKELLYRVLFERRFELKEIFSKLKP